MVEDILRAAGVVVLRRKSRKREVLTVHRPHRADWSLPKGKVEFGEHILAAAIRECDEETGYQVTLGPCVGTMEYIAAGRPKRVDYWLAEVVGDEGFAPDDEVDSIAWVPIKDAGSHLTYAADVELVQRAAAIPPTTPFVVLRHAKAIKRSDFTGSDDDDRPLSGRGRGEAKALAPLLEAFGVRSIHSSSAKRCTATVRPFARRIDVETVPEKALTEHAHDADAEEAARRIVELYARCEPTVVVSHRPVLPTLLDALAAHTGVPEDESWDPRLSPAAFVVIHRDSRGGVVGVERYPAPERS
ncbi:MAG: NUDIX hydrolase [Actinobacteria bacterium]|nr:NUDIX hydrolase [Actinomycetota bacterium]